ncbi:hypothetical protein ACFTWF_24405 [Rhodococcus sp. NPDC056960]|uniref:hypothetical protein n=1 Tax=Rhodococcus sp. NPDC056960 TaxID=3345982 RepID=UPI003641AD8B
MTALHLTTDHEQIRCWVQTNHGAPARIPSEPGTAGDTLCLDFLGLTARDVDHLTWHDWFTLFDNQHLALSYTTTEPHVRPRWELVHRGRATP